MSEHWEVYSCQMGESPAVIAYDHGIRETIDSHPETQNVRFELHYRAPGENGLPTGAELELGRRIEGAIGAFLSERSGILVGKITVGGIRYFQTYVGADEPTLAAFTSAVGKEHSCHLSFSVADDPEREAYWQDLFPTADDWQLIQDSKVVEALRSRGDPLRVPRRIDHWAFFPSARNRDAFSVWLRSEGFIVESAPGPGSDGETHAVHFHRVDQPELSEINHLTFRLRHEAEEAGGRYDGWEDRGRGGRRLMVLPCRSERTSKSPGTPFHRDAISTA